MKLLPELSERLPELSGPSYERNFNNDVFARLLCCINVAVQRKNSSVHLSN